MGCRRNVWLSSPRTSPWPAESRSAAFGGKGGSVGQERREASSAVDVDDVIQTMHRIVEKVTSDLCVVRGRIWGFASLPLGADGAVAIPVPPPGRRRRLLLIYGCLCCLILGARERERDD